MQLSKSDTGFYYDVTDAEIQAHKKRSIVEIFTWLEDANSFIASIQTPTDRENMHKARGTSPTFP